MMNSNLQFHDGLKLLLDENSYILKSNNQLIVKKDDDSPIQKMSSEKISMIILFLLENKSYISEADIPTIESISQHLIKSVGNDDELKNRIDSSFSAILPSPNLNTLKPDQGILSQLEFYKTAAIN